MRKTSLVLVLFLFLTQAEWPQTATIPKKGEADEKLETAAVDLIRETAAEVNNMRSLENRLSLGSEMASLMWFHDEKEARNMYAGVIGDFHRLILEYDSRQSQMPPSDDAPLAYYSPFSVDMTDQMKIARKFTVALTIRQQITVSLADHDPEMAINFYYDSVLGLTSQKFRDQADATDRSFEFQLITMLAANNSAKALDMARKSLEHGVSYQHVELLKQMYAKGPDKAADFAAAILNKIKDEPTKASDLWIYSSFLDFAATTYEASKKPGGKAAILDESQVGDLADFCGQIILNQKTPSYTNLAQIEKYAPSRAAQIRAKFGLNRSQTGSGIAPKIGVYGDSSVATANAMNVAGNSLVQQQRLEEVRAAAEAADKKLADDVAGLGKKEMSKDERDQVVADLRKTISQSGTREKKISSLCLLAFQVSHLGDKDLAKQIMLEAENLTTNQPQNYQDFLFTWMIISGYADVDPDRAFGMLDDTILRANDVISAFIKVAGFIDVQGEILDDGEVQVGAFGGSMIRQLTLSLQSGRGVVRTLAKTDFARTKALTDRFDRPETRILAKMMLIRAILGDGKPSGPAKSDDVIID